MYLRLESRVQGILAFMYLFIDLFQTNQNLNSYCVRYKPVLNVRIFDIQIIFIWKVDYFKFNFKPLQC